MSVSRRLLLGAAPAALLTSGTAVAGMAGQPFERALAAYYATRDYGRRLCAGPCSEEALDDLLEKTSHRMLELLQAPASQPSHAYELLRIAHRNLFHEGTLENWPMAYVPIGDHLLHDWSNMDRAFIEAAMRITNQSVRGVSP